MKKLGFTTLLVAGLTLAAVFGVMAIADHGQDSLRADILTGYQESAPAAISSTATGTFTATIDDKNQTINFVETYSGLSTPATQSHIHFGNRNQNGGVSAFLCGPQPAAGSKGLCPPGNTPDTVTVSGTIVPADVIGPTGQGIDPGQWQKLVDALRAGVAYANVHSTKFPAGEIRAQINDPDQEQPAVQGPSPGHTTNGHTSNGHDHNGHDDSSNGSSSGSSG